MLVMHYHAFSVKSKQVKLMSPFYKENCKITSRVTLDIRGNEISSRELSKLLTQHVGPMKSLFVLFDMTLITHNFTAAAN